MTLIFLKSATGIPKGREGVNPLQQAAGDFHPVSTALDKNWWPNEAQSQCTPLRIAADWWKGEEYGDVRNSYWNHKAILLQYVHPVGGIYQQHCLPQPFKFNILLLYSTIFPRISVVLDINMGHRGRYQDCTQISSRSGKAFSSSRTGKYNRPPQQTYHIPAACASETQDGLYCKWLTKGSELHW